MDKLLGPQRSLEKGPVLRHFPRQVLHLPVNADSTQ